MSSTASFLMFVIGIPIFIFVVIGPMYCVVKIAKFKKRNSAVWTFFAIFASIPAFIAVSFLPSLRSNVEKDSYLAKFTPIHDTIGYALAATISILIIGYFYLRLYTAPLIPALQNPWIHVHVPIGLIAYSSGFASFILCIIRVTKRIPMPRAVLRLQLSAVTMLFLTIISGSIWAHHAWGTYWSWDPKETWSLILLSIMIATTTYLTINVPARIKGLLLLSIQLAAIVFVTLLDRTLAGLHSFAVLF